MTELPNGSIDARSACSKWRNPRLAYSVYKKPPHIDPNSADPIQLKDLHANTSNSASYGARSPSAQPMLIHDLLLRDFFHGMVFHPDLETHPLLFSDFEPLSTDPSDPSWKCLVCDRVMKNYVRHSQTAKHHERVAHFEAHVAAQSAVLPGLDAANSPVPDPPPMDPQIDLIDEVEAEPPERQPSPFSYLRAVEVADLLQTKDAEDSELEDDMHKMAEAIWALEQDGGSDKEDDRQDDIALENHSQTCPASAEWYPFKRKEHVVALLIIGSTRSILSRLQYHRIRSILRICDVDLPKWGAIRSLSKKLKSNFGLEVSDRISPHGHPLFGLKVQTIISIPHLVCLPELATHNEPVNRFSQSKKWREDFSKELRVQMVVHRGKHYYIYEPLLTIAEKLVVPAFFYQLAGKTMAKCLPAKLQYEPPSNLQVLVLSEPPFHSTAFQTIEVADFWKPAPEITLEDEHGADGSEKLPIVNPWRNRAKGLIIKHIPITLYSDDTSGNVSKKWNKHMSIFFTLSGLPPKMTNQEYNIHFLATSNFPNAIHQFFETFQFSTHSSQGFTTYNHLTGTEVCVMVVVLCHLGDGPMHAEITNTTSPANTLTPCRICDLHVTRMSDKKSEQYVASFIGVNRDGEMVVLPQRDWQLTRARTEALWALAQTPRAKSALETEARKWGLRDQILDFFIKMVHQAYDSPQAQDEDSVSALCTRLNQTFGAHLFNPMLRLKGEYRCGNQNLGGGVLFLKQLS
ncbi:hypothetical protein DFH28DRAFT_1132026 [Melampsora americana]|nr:hypothetical protein DFH28DRAFT_1132026 [Melampsora americana]